MDTLNVSFFTAKNIIIYLFVINAVGYFMMWYDKRCAQSGQWRVKEKTLHTISLLGGSIGSLIGMYHFKHKTKHNSFKIGIPVIIFLQLCIIAAVAMNLHVVVFQAIKESFSIK